MMVRTFLPVGQGAFYVERFENKIYVYDCGTSTDLSLLENEIQNTFEYRQEIEAVFISHIHTDHVNGLEYLLSYCRVRTVYLPYLTPQELAIAYAGVLCGRTAPSPFLTGLLEDSAGMISGQSDTGTVFVYPDQQDDAISPYNFSKSINYSVIKSGEAISVRIGHCTDWVYVPFNFRNKSRTSAFFKQLSKHEIRPEDIGDIDIFKRNWRNIDFRRKLTLVYESIDGDVNTNSLVVFSGLKKESFGKYCIMRNERYNYCKYFRHFDDLCGYKPGCLYLGDYDTSGKNKWKELISKGAVSDYLEQVGMIQVPHHGSKHNYNPEMANFQSIFIISAGKNNKYRHPSNLVVDDILLKNHKLFIVTEEKQTAARFVIHFCT